MTNKVYVASFDGSITVIDGKTNAVADWYQIVSQIPNAVDGIVCNPETGKLYTVVWPANNGPSAIFVIDIKSKAVIKTLSNAGNLAWLAVNRKTNRIYAPLTFGGVWVIDGKTDKLITTIPVGDLPSPPGCPVYTPGCVTSGSILEWAAVNETTNRIYVTGAFDGSLFTIDGATNKLINTIYTGFGYYSVTTDPIKNVVYPLDVTFDLLNVVDGRTNRLTDNVSSGTPSFPMNCAYTNLNPNVPCISNANSTQGLATNPVTGKIYVANGASFFGPPKQAYVTVLRATQSAP